MPASRASYALFSTLLGGAILATHGCGSSPSETSEPAVDAAAAAAITDATIGSHDAHDTGAVATGTTDAAVDATVRDSGAAAGLSILQHHNHASRDGVYVDPAMTPAAVATLHVDTTFVGTVTGDVYAQPLYVSNGPNNKEAFYVATESNHVTALGSPGWDKTFGTPKTGSLAGQPCGIVDPLGITSTPIIDLASRTLYFDAMVSTDDNATLAGITHEIFAISIDDGTTKTGWPVNVGPLFTTVGTKAANQNQRGALALVDGILYAAYGGHVGDCTPYRGVVIGIPVATPSTPTIWSTESIGMTAGRGGMWASGGVASDGTSIYVATGNTSTDDGASTFSAPAAWSGGEAVFRFGSGPTFSNNPVDYYYPTNWAALDKSDSDLGGANPIVFDMPGAPMPHLLAAFGKDGNLYLINRDSMGRTGGGGELTIAPVANGVILGAPAVYTTSQGTYVAMRAKGVGCPGGSAGNLVVAKISPGTAAAPAPTAAVVWCAAETNLGSPMVTTTDGMSNVVVWDASTHLYGYDGDTGTKVFAGGTTADALANAMQYFNTPINAGQGRIAVATSGKLYLFTP